MGILIIIACIVAFIAYCIWGKEETSKPPVPKKNDNLVNSQSPHGRKGGGSGRRAKSPSRQVAATIKTPLIDPKWEATSRALKDHLLPAEILAIPLTEGYTRIVEELQKRYPMIPFDLPPMEDQIHEYAAREEYLSRSGLSPDHETITPRQILRGVLSTIRDNALDAYLSHRPDFSTHPAIPKGVGSASFWQNEGDYRTADPGNGDPQDWSERRWVVYCRDKSCCRFCGRGLALDEFHVHHIQGRSLTGNHQLDNLVTLCTSCHSLMPSHTMDLVKPRSRSVKERRVRAVPVKKRELDEWTQELVNKTVRSLAAKHKLHTPKK
jgi:hypothetical protein